MGRARTRDEGRQGCLEKQPKGIILRNGMCPLPEGAIHQTVPKAQVFYRGDGADSVGVIEDGEKTRGKAR